MVKVFLDTNVVIDLLGKREPFFEDAKVFLHLAQNEMIKLFIAESSLGNLYYLVFEIYKIPQAAEILRLFFSICEILPGGKEIVFQSLNSDFKDKEDGLQYFTAAAHEMDFIVTRDKKGFKSATQIPILSPKEFFAA